MKLWKEWWYWTSQLREACSRERTFFWLATILAGFTIREDMLGVTSFVRCLGLHECCYGCILDSFHSSALNTKKLARIWTRLLILKLPGVIRIKDRILLAVDGIKVPKSGKKMPGVKTLHQESESNTKPEYITGHSCQAAALLVKKFNSIIAVPLSAQIHEGVVFSNRDKRTLLDKMILLIDKLDIPVEYYLIADAYYASAKTVCPLLEKNNHLITRVRNNSVAYQQAIPSPTRKRGRPRKYGEKVHLRSLFNEPDKMTEIESPVYDEEGVKIRIRTIDLLWKPAGRIVRFVIAVHPTRGQCILMTTDLQLNGAEIIKAYGYRFKIEVAFKQAVHITGAFGYHFWMKGMTPLKRKPGNQYMHMESEKYRNAVRRKLEAYYRYIQIGLIAQGLMQVISLTATTQVWKCFGSWLRTVRPGRLPTEFVVAVAMRNCLPEFLADRTCAVNFTKFLLGRIDISRTEGSKLVA